MASISIPMWFPPVRRGGHTYLDAVFISDANLEEAIDRGADELWVIWTVSERSEWWAGFVGIYFGIIETVANGNFRRVLRRIERNNTEVAAGRSGEFGRHIEVKVLRAEVPRALPRGAVRRPRARVRRARRRGRASVVYRAGHRAARPRLARGCGWDPLAVHRRDEGLRGSRPDRVRARARSSGSGGPATDGPPHDHARWRPPVHRRPRSRRDRGRLDRVGGVA